MELLEHMFSKEEINENIIQEKEKIESDIDNLQNNELEYEKLPQELYENGWFLNKNELLITYNYRPDWWDEQEDKSRINNEFFYTVKKINSKDYEICWKTRDERATETYAISEKFVSKKFITETDNNRNRILGQNANLGDLPRDKGVIKDFWAGLITHLNKHNIQRILDRNFEVLQEKGLEEREKRYEFQTFEDYPEKVQNEANEIIEENEFFKELLATISWKHEGDKETAILLLLSCGSIFIGEPVHQLLNNARGKGKSNIFLNTRELLPDQYVMDLRNFSNKYLYYNAKNLNPDYNILFFDDLPLNNEKVEILKELSDNNAVKKILRTLIEQKVVEFELPGLYLSLMNRAKSDIDSELEDRHYINSLDSGAQRDSEVKNKILQNSIRNQDTYLEKKRFVLKACFQKLIDNKVKIFNPYLILFNTLEHGNRNINHYTGFVKANTFYHQNKRTKIEGITIGTYEDMNFVLQILTEAFDIQKHKLKEDDIKIINHLRENPELNTYKQIAKATGLSNSQVKHKINGRENIQGLENKGFVKKIYIDDDDHKKGVLIHLVENDFLTVDKETNLITIVTAGDEEEDSPLILKWVVVVSFLEWLQILINNTVVSRLKILLEEKSQLLFFNYNSLVSFLKKVLEAISNDIIYIEDEDSYQSRDINYHQVFVTEKFKEFFNFIKKNNESVTSKQNLTLSPQKSEITHNVELNTLNQCNQTKKELTNDIENDILKILNKDSDLLISELIQKLPVYKTEQDDNFNLINQTVKALANKNKVSVYGDKLTISSSPQVFNTQICKLFKNNKSLAKKELIETLPDIKPNLDNEESKLEKINDLIKKGLIEESNGILTVLKDFETICSGGST
jgi:winged helix-turn-helix DNA-binding protein